MIPPRVILEGDKTSAQTLLGLARNQLRILRREMSFQKLNRGIREIKPWPGVLIFCSSVFSQDVIRIRVNLPDGGAGVRKKIIEDETRKCICMAMFAMGIIRDETPGGPVRTDFETDYAFNQATRSWVTENLEMLKSTLFKYGVDVCKGDSYEYHPEIPANGWGRYYIGQHVLVTVGYFEDQVAVDLVWDPEEEVPEDFDYCSKNCLMSYPQFAYHSISPLHVHGMPEWLWVNSRLEILEDVI